jgi:hypothetical protein
MRYHLLPPGLAVKTLAFGNQLISCVREFFRARGLR